MFHYLWKLRHTLLIQIGAALISITGIAAMPYIVKLLFDYDFSKGMKGAAFIVVLYSLAIAVGMLFEYVSQRTGWKFRQQFFNLVKQDLFDALLSQDYVDFKKHDQSDYLSYFQNDVDVFRQYAEALIEIFQTALQLLIYGFFLFKLDYRLALVIIASSICSLIVPKLTGKQLTGRKAEHLEAVAQYTDTLQDLLSGFRFVNRETRQNISRRHQNSLGTAEEKEYRFGSAKTATNVVTGSSMYFLQSIVFAVIGVLLFQQQITVGVASAALGYIQDFCYPVSYILKDINNANACRAGRDKVLSLLATKKDNDSREQIDSFERNIEFYNVEVQLDDFHFGPFSYRFEKGKKYAIIGASGSGKSTILNLLMQYIQPDKGELLLDGKSICGKDSSKVMVCINQFEHLFHASIRENASVFGTYSKDKMDEGLCHFQNEKLNSLLDKENAQELSGGEGQLLQLLRSVTADKPIVLMDEAFSAVDASNAKQLQKQLLALDKTILFITHNVSEENLSDFDEIIELKRKA